MVAGQCANLARQSTIEQAMTDQHHFPTSLATMQYMAARNDTAMLAFSTGKDSIAAWLAMRPHFRRIVPYYMYLVPGLQFVERSLAYYEEWFGCQIIRVPHPSLYRWLNACIFQPPERVRIIERLNLPEPEYIDIQNAMRQDYGLAGAYVATGVRAADSPIRRMALTRHGSINHDKMQFWPVWDWNKARLIEEIESAGVKLPVEYRWFGRSFDGLDYRFLEPLKRFAPDDYERILQWFPLADVEIARRQYA